MVLNVKTLYGLLLHGGPRVCMVCCYMVGHVSVWTVVTWWATCLFGLLLLYSVHGGPRVCMDCCYMAGHVSVVSCYIVGHLSVWTFVTWWATCLYGLLLHGGPRVCIDFCYILGHVSVWTVVPWLTTCLSAVDFTPSYCRDALLSLHQKWLRMAGAEIVDETGKLEKGRGLSDRPYKGRGEPVVTGLF